MTKFLGLSSSTAWAGQTDKHKHRAFLSQWQLLLAATRKMVARGKPSTTPVISQKRF